MAQYIKAKLVTVKFPHRCAWCADLIYSKEDAMYILFKTKEHLHQKYLHPECWRARGKIHDHNDDYPEPGDYQRGSTKLCP